MALALLVVVVYLLLCLAVFASQKRKRAASARAAAALVPAAAAAPPLLVAFASQTGTAQALAWETARSLHTAGVPVRVTELSAIAAEDLRAAQRVLFLVSTYGEGDPPDNAALFARRLMGERLPLPDLHYGLLAMGDSGYANYRGFGLALEEWLQAQGASRLFERIDVDNADDAALLEWQRCLSRIAGTGDLPDWQAPAFAEWRMSTRMLLNPGSAGAPCFHVELTPPPAASGSPQWEAGDLLQVLAPGDPRRPREYSIASLPADGTVHLLVRQERHPDGTLGVASGWLTEGAPAGARVKARLRPHPGFRLGDNAGRPLILIGNGTGLAGLRGLIKARVAGGARRNWLVYGERNVDADCHYRDDIDQWHGAGFLEIVDRVFSRDPGEHRYVQHRLAARGDTVRQWVREGAAIYVCGSLQGMAAGVDEALAGILTREGLDLLAEQGRYRRDVY
jgi:sulfite reductase (NADPH) flavoprotein alpha-component